jgi:hypothetical protein
MCSGCYSSILCDMHVYEKFHLLFCLALLEIQRSQRVSVEINTCSLLVFIYTNAELYNLTSYSLHLTYVFQDISFFGSQLPPKPFLSLDINPFLVFLFCTSESCDKLCTV